MISFFLGMFIGAFLICCWGIYLSRQKAAQEQRNEKYRQEEHHISEMMCTSIMKLANQQMAKCEYKNGIPFRRSVVVEYDILLKIWDIADKLKWRI